MQSALRRRFLRVMLLSVAGAVLWGCGQKGPLYLPEEVLEKKKKEKTSASDSIKPHRS